MAKAKGEKAKPKVEPPAPDVAPAPERQPVGRPSSFRPEFVVIAKVLAERGATDAEIADALEVSVRTVYRWKGESPEFCQALNAGKEFPDDRVQRSLYQRATGYDYVEQQAFKVKVGQYEERVDVVEVLRHQPADTTAQIFWLKNRRRDEWRDRIEHSGPNGGAIPLENRRTIDLEQLRGLPPEERQMLRNLLISAVQQMEEEPEAIEGEFEARE